MERVVTSGDSEGKWPHSLTNVPPPIDKGNLTSVDGLEGQILGSVYIFIYTALSAPPSRPGKNQSSLSLPY